MRAAAFLLSALLPSAAAVFRQDSALRRLGAACSSSVQCAGVQVCFRNACACPDGYFAAPGGVCVFQLTNAGLQAQPSPPSPPSRGYPPTTPISPQEFRALNQGFHAGPVIEQRQSLSVPLPTPSAPEGSVPPGGFCSRFEECKGGSFCTGTICRCPKGYGSLGGVCTWVGPEYTQPLQQTTVPPPPPPRVDYRQPSIQEIMRQRTNILTPPFQERVPLGPEENPCDNGLVSVGGVCVPPSFVCNLDDGCTGGALCVDQLCSCPTGTAWESDVSYCMPLGHGSLLDERGPKARPKGDRRLSIGETLQRRVPKYFTVTSAPTTTVTIPTTTTSHAPPAILSQRSVKKDLSSRKERGLRDSESPGRSVIPLGGRCESSGCVAGAMCHNSTCACVRPYFAYGTVCVRRAAISVVKRYR